MTITHAVITFSTRAPRCKELDCKRRTKSPSGYCWQHDKELRYKKLSEFMLGRKKAKP